MCRHLVQQTLHLLDVANLKTVITNSIRSQIQDKDGVDSSPNTPQSMSPVIIHRGVGLDPPINVIKHLKRKIIDEESTSLVCDNCNKEDSSRPN